MTHPEETQQLIVAIDDLKDEVRVLRDAIDELRTEMQWFCNNTSDRMEFPAGNQASDEIETPVEREAPLHTQRSTCQQKLW